MSLSVAVLPAYLRTPRDAAWLGRGVKAPLRQPEIGRMVAALSRVRQQRLVPVLFVMKHLARREYRRGQRAPDRWRTNPAPPPGELGAS